MANGTSGRVSKEEYLKIFDMIGKRIEFPKEVHPEIEGLVTKEFERLKNDYPFSERIEKAYEKVAGNIMNFSRYCISKKNKRNARWVVNVFLYTTERILRNTNNNHKPHFRETARYLSRWGNLINKRGKYRERNNKRGDYLPFNKQDAEWVSRDFISHEFGGGYYCSNRSSQNNHSFS